MPPGHHGQEVLKRTLTAAKVDSVEYAQAKAEMKLIAGKRGLDAVMDEYDLDALFMVREDITRLPLWSVTLSVSLSFDYRCLMFFY
jgi:hypothetical protein